MDERGLPVHPEIVTYATQSAFFTAYDCLDIGKVKVEVATYERGQGQTGRAVAYLDAADLRLVIHALKTAQFDLLFGGKFEAFGGSQRDGAVESRVLRLEHDAGDNGRFARFPLRLTVSNGPGKTTANGGIAPDGEPKARVSIRFSMPDLLRLLLETEAYMDAYLSAHIERIRAERAKELEQKLGRRDSNDGIPEGASPSVLSIRDPDASISRSQRGYILGLAERLGIADLDTYLGKPLDELTKGEASRVIRELKAAPPPQPADEIPVDWAAEIRRIGKDKFGWDAARSESAAARKMGKAFGELSEDELRAVTEAMNSAPLKKAA